MKRLSKGRKKKKFRRRVFFSLLIIDILMVTIFGSIAYITYIDETRKRNDLTMDAAGERVKNTLENVMTGMREYYMGISDNDEITWLLEQEEVPYRAYNEVISAQKTLQGNYSILGYVDDYTFINLRDEWVLSNSGMYPMDELKNRGDVERFLEEQKNEIASVYWHNKMENESANTAQVSESKTMALGGMFLMEWFVGPGDHRGVLIVRLDMNRIRDLISEVKEDYDICLYSKEGKLIYTTSDELYEDSKKVMTEFNGRNDWKNLRETENNNYSMNLYSSTKDGVDCVIGYDMDWIRESGEHLLFILLSFGGGLIAVLGICFFLSGRISKPVNELVHSIQVILGEEEEDVFDEFLFLENGMAELQNNHVYMQRLIYSQKKILLEHFMEHMIRGELPQEEIDNNLQQFGIETKACYRLLAVIGLLEEENGDLEKEVVNMMVVRQIPEDLSRDLFLPPICYGEEILLLVGAENESELKNRVMLIYQKMTEYVQITYKMSVAVGGSQVFHLLKHMKTAYHEAMETLRNETTALYFDEKAIAFYEDFADRKYVKNVYDTVGENMLTEALDQCDREHVFQLLGQFVDRMWEAEVIRHERSYYMNRLLVAMLNVPSNAGIMLNQIFGGHTQDIFMFVRKPYDKDRWKSFLRDEVAIPIMNALVEFRGSNASGIKEQVIKLIKESKGSITLAECAQTLGYHPSYIWKILKSDGNQNFTELVNLEKLEMAKQMLLHSKDSVAKIAEELGYSNTQNFIRFFSKYVGTTPGKFRKEKAGEDSGE